MQMSETPSGRKRDRRAFRRYAGLSTTALDKSCKMRYY
jgi:hypothetical protein